MRRLLAPVLATLALTASGLALTTNPAHAAGEPVISAIDVSTPGHATGTVTSDAAYVAVVLHANGAAWELGEPTFVGTTGGSASFDLETWGLDTGVVSARACTGQTIDSCGLPALSPSFTPLDVTPQVTWPEDTTIGTGQVYTVSVSDTAGGNLVAQWEHDYWQTDTALSRSEPTTLPLTGDGEGDITVRRCSSLAWNVCHATGVRHVTVNRVLSNWSEDYWLGEISPAVGTKAEPVIHVYEGQSFTLDWHVTDSATGQALPGVGGQIADLTADAEGNIRPVFDLGAVTTNNKNYDIEGTLSYQDPDFGTVTGPIRAMTFRIDTVAPAISSIKVSASSVYPYADGYRDKVTVTVQPVGSDQYATVRLEVLNSSDTVIKSFPLASGYDASQFVWNGKTGSGTFAPAGGYHFRATIKDQAKNPGQLIQGSVTVVRKKLVARTFKKTVSAAGSLEDQYVGRCSTLRKPSLRGWSGSLGLYTNTKCRRTFEDGLIVTVHAVRTPAGAVRYGDFRVSAYGGAAKAAPRSLAYLEYLNRAEDWVADTRMGTSLTTHNGATRAGSNFVWGDRYVVWGAYTAEGAKYDIKSFTVRLTYFVLVLD